MRDELIAERSRAQNLELELATMKMSYSQVTQKLKTLEVDNDSLNILLRNGGSHLSYPTNLKPSVMYKLLLLLLLLFLILFLLLLFCFNFYKCNFSLPKK